MEWLARKIPEMLDDYVKKNKVRIDPQVRKQLDQIVGRARKKDHARGRRNQGAVASHEYP